MWGAPSLFRHRLISERESSAKAAMNKGFDETARRRGVYVGAERRDGPDTPRGARSDEPRRIAPEFADELAAPPQARDRAADPPARPLPLRRAHLPN